MSEDDDNGDDDSIADLFDFSDLSISNRVGEIGKDDDVASTSSSCTTSTTRSQQRKLKRQSKRERKSKSQHSLDYLRQRVSFLMSIFEEKGWFIPLPEPPAASESNSKDDGSKKGKVWSNRNYGADKKRQRKQDEKQMLDARISQLEAVLADEHGMTLEQIDDRAT